MITEIALVACITVTILVVVGQAWVKGGIGLFSPAVFFALLIFYYVVAGPLYFLFNDELVYLETYVRPLLWKGWLASSVAFGSFLIGYVVYRRERRFVRQAPDERSVARLGVFAFSMAAAGMLYWILKFGGGVGFLNPTFNEDSAELSVQAFGSAAAVYMLQLINLSFAGVILTLLFALQRRSRATSIIFACALICSVLFFIKTGFRYRLAWMLVGLAVAYHLWKGSKPRLLFWLPAGAIFVGLMGLIGITRNYFGGLSLERTEGLRVKDYYAQGMSEASIFLSMCQVIDSIPARTEHTSWDPIWVAITYPIPRNWWPDKPLSQTLAVISESFGTNASITAGAAVPYFGEWYIAFGWTGIAISSCIFGWLAKWLWLWYLERPRDKFAIVIYSVSIGFMYVVFSRGFLAQVMLNFCFAILPLIIFYKIVPKVHMLLPTVYNALSKPNNQVTIPRLE